MRSELELTEKIEQYLAGEMNAADKDVFEKQIAADAQLREEVKLQEDVMKGLERVILKQNTQQAYRKYRTGNNFLRWGLTGLGIVLITGAIYLGNNTGTKNELPKVAQIEKENNITVTQEDHRTSPEPVITPSISIAATSTSVVEATTVADLYKKFEKPFQVFNIQAGKDTVLKCAEGTTIKIDANSFVWGKMNAKTEGIVQVRVREYYKNSDIVLANLSTTTKKEILETGGMLYVEALYKGETCKIKNGKEIELGFPYKDKKKDMKLFGGKRDSAERMEWTLNTAPKETENFLDVFNQLKKDQDQSLGDQIIPGKGFVKTTEEQERLQREALKKIGGAISTSGIDVIVPEIMPEFPGGQTELQKYLSQNAIYPSSSYEKGIQGTVYVQFKVDQFGVINNVIVLKGLDQNLDKVAYSLVKKMPKWNPATASGKALSSQYTLPIKFTIKDNNYKEMNAQSKAIEEELKNVKVAYTKNGAAEADSSYKIQYATALTNKIVSGKSSSYEINSCFFSTSQLGWINCDRFANDRRAKINFIVNYNASENTDMKLVFHSAKSIFPGYRVQGSKYSFSSVPLGEKITIVAFNYDNGKPMMAVKESTISAAGESLVFEPVTIEKLKAEMEKLNKFSTSSN